MCIRDRYQVVFFGLPLPGHQFAIDGAFGFLMFHALSLCGVAVALGAAYFLIARWRRRAEPGATSGFHVAPLLLLLAVALTGLALPPARDEKVRGAERDRDAAQAVSYTHLRAHET